jgi:solute carrier family 45, member 1/2/4
MIYGSACTVISLLALSWTEEIADWIYTVLSQNSGEIENNATYSAFRITMAMFWIYILYPSIAVVQSSIKAFIVDNCPSHQQVHAAAWSARLQGLGSILGYLTGTGNAILPFEFIVSLGFKSASVVACFALTISVAVSTIFISGESVHPQSNRQLLGLVGFFYEIWRDMRKLPASIKHICFVQFFAWMGWFPFLFYATAYASQQCKSHVIQTFPREMNK